MLESRSRQDKVSPPFYLQDNMKEMSKQNSRNLTKLTKASKEVENMFEEKQDLESKLAKLFEKICRN